MTGLYILLCVLFVGIREVNCQDKIYNFREEEPEGSFIGNIALDLNLAALIPPPVFSTLKYSIMNWADGNGFRVDEKNSGLFTKYRLDRERLCRFEVRCVLRLRVAARSETEVKKYTIAVNLMDINDNPPKFNNTVFSLRISESVTVGKKYSIPGALDDDRGQENSIQSYEFTPSIDIFRVEYFQHIDGTSDVNLVVSKPLDREIIDFYSLVLVAKDGGSPVHSASLTIEIHVTDDNDNTPRFSQSQYNVQIGEGTPSGTVIVAVSAEDDDIGTNAAVSYRLSARQEASMVEKFHIDSLTGQITAKVPLNSGSYTIIVEAVDGGTPQRANQTVVLVTVIDTENNPPIIIIDPLNQDSRNAHISEAANKNAVVAHVTVYDPDSGRNGIVLCYSQSAFFDLQALGDNDYTIIVVRTLDREQNSDYRVTLFCEDSGTPRLNATKVFDVTVDDVNDNGPMFYKTNEEIRIYEDNAINDVAMLLSASDKDVGINAQISFTLLNDSNGFFNIPAGSNILVCARRLDREIQDMHVVTVLARDGGTPSLSSTATVTVSVLDINDVAPQFLRTEYKFSISEGQPSGTSVGSVSAFDLDLMQGGEIEFSLLDWSRETRKFKILPDGALITLEPLDREQCPIFTFSVEATDRGSPRLKSQVQVEVEVKDINDNAPVFLFPSSINNSAVLNLPVDKSKTLLKLRAVDADEGENGKMHFYLHPGNTSQLFYVDAITDELRAARTFSIDDIGMYNLSITVSDRGLPPLNTTKYLLVHVKMNPELQPLQSFETTFMLVIGLVCGTVPLAAIFIAVFCFMKRREKGKPLRYLDNKYGNSAPRVKNTDTLPSQYDSQKEAKNGKSMSEVTETLSGYTTFSAPSPGLAYTKKISPSLQQEQMSIKQREVEQYDLQISPGVRMSLDKITKGDEPDKSDIELNRVTSLRLQQALQHISSFKSGLITASDTNKLYKWREFQIPSHPNDFGSLSSRGTGSHNHNMDSGIGTDDDAVFLPSSAFPSRHKSSVNHHAINSIRPVHSARYFSKPGSDSSVASSFQPSSSFLSTSCMKPTGDIFMFRSFRVRSYESHPSETIDDQCTTTSGSYSITADDQGGGSGRGSIQNGDVNRVLDVYV